MELSFNELLDIAAKVVKLPKADVEKNCRYLEDLDAYYFWNSQRGGCSVIVAKNGEKLGATSSVSFEKLKAAFESGMRR